MAHLRIPTPATFRRAFLFSSIAFCTIAFAASPPMRPPDLAQVGKPDAAEAARLLTQFRGAGIPGDYFLDFALHSLPRRGEEKVYRGRMWGSRNEQGAITRIELQDGDGRTHRLLIQNGERAAVWRFADGKAVKLGGEQLFEPLIPGVQVNAFDVQMPFLYWPDATLERITRVSGRPAHAYVFRPPGGFPTENTGVAAVKAFLDTQFNALMQTQIIGANSRPVKTFTLLSLKTVDNQPLPKTADYRDERTRDKTRLVVNGAALDIDVPAGAFEPAALARDLPPPAGVVPM